MNKRQTTRQRLKAAFSLERLLAKALFGFPALKAQRALREGRK
jgi:hypothetical protein